MPAKTTNRKRASHSKKTTAKKSSAKRSVKKAAENVQSNADRARDIAAALIRAGELLGQGAAFMDALAERATNPAPTKRTHPKS